MSEKPCIKPGSGDSFKDCQNCPEMVIAPAGSFTMGSPESEPERYSDEGPQHRVKIGRPFAVGKYAVTFAEWDACVAAGGCDGRKPADQGWGRGDHPVIDVNWSDAKAYISWLSKKTGKGYRLVVGGRIRICGAGGDGDAVLVGFVDHAGASKLRWQRGSL